MTCARTRSLLSALRDGDVPPRQERQLREHLRRCSGCAARWHQAEAMLGALASLPAPPPAGLASAVLEHLALESRSPGLTMLSRPRTAARPLLLPSLVTAGLLFCATAAHLLAPTPHDADRPRVAYTRWEDWGGPPARVLLPTAPVSAPLPRVAVPRGPLTEMREGTLFVETFVASDGQVSRLRILGGDRVLPSSLADVLSRQRFEPGRFEGRPVAVAVYRLFDRLDVSAPLS